MSDITAISAKKMTEKSKEKRKIEYWKKIQESINNQATVCKNYAEIIVPPKNVQEFMDRLKEQGYNVSQEKEPRFWGCDQAICLKISW